MTQTWRYQITFEGTVDADGTHEAEEFALEEVAVGGWDYRIVNVEEEADE